MRPLPERAVAAFTDALVAERLGFLGHEQRSSTARFVVERWRVAAQPVRFGTGVVATALDAGAWSLAALGGSDRNVAWRRVVHGVSGRPLPGISELSTFVLSLATAYAAERWPDAALAPSARS